MSAGAQEDLDKKYSDMTNKDGEYYGAISLRTMTLLKDILMCEDNDRKDWEDFIKNKMHISTERTDF